MLKALLRRSAPASEASLGAARMDADPGPRGGRRGRGHHQLGGTGLHLGGGRGGTRGKGTS